MNDLAVTSFSSPVLKKMSENAQIMCLMHQITLYVIAVLVFVLPSINTGTHWSVHCLICAADDILALLAKSLSNRGLKKSISSHSVIIYKTLYVLHLPSSHKSLIFIFESKTRERLFWATVLIAPLHPRHFRCSKQNSINAPHITVFVLQCFLAFNSH